MRTAFSRRRFLGQTGIISAGLLSDGPGIGAEERKGPILPVAGVVTEYRRDSHADVILSKILEGYQQDGGRGPDLRLVSLYTDLVPKNDLSRDLAKKHGFRIAKTIGEALTLGGGKLAVAGVINIAEQGSYPVVKETGQKMYPRRRFFDEVMRTFRKTGRVVPLFNDKHLAYAWNDAKHMYDTARDMKIPFLAGSSVPVAWRTPSITLPIGSVLTEALGVGYGGHESYGIHALEGMQCLVERRKGGETGVTAVQAVRGEEIARAQKAGRWSRELLDAAVALMPLPRTGRPKDLAKDAVFFLIEYRDGLRAAVAMSTGLAAEFMFAGRVRGAASPVAIWFRTPEARPYGHFAHLLRAIEHTIHAGRPAYPVERTLLTTGILDAAMHSLAEGGRLMKTPHLAISYRPADWPFAQGKPPA